MGGDSTPDRSARVTYRSIASIYDEMTGQNDHEMWLGELLPLLEKHGLKKGRLLDLGCGTGKAFEPMLKRGWQVVGCDVSPEMLEEARRKFDGRVSLQEADLREPRALGEFELVLALNGVVNSLLEDRGLEKALTTMRANLAPGGLGLFDADTLKLYEERFSGGFNETMSAGGFRWLGESTDAGPGDVFEARIVGDGVDQKIRLRHRPEAEIRAALEAAGMESVASVGQEEFESGGIALAEPPEEGRDYKVIHIVRAA